MVEGTRGRILFTFQLALTEIGVKMPRIDDLTRGNRLKQENPCFNQLRRYSAPRRAREFDIWYGDRSWERSW